MLDKGESNEVHNIDDLSNRLYRRDLVGKKKKINDFLRPVRFSVSEDWNSLPAAKNKIQKTINQPSFFKKFFFYSLGFAFVAFLIAFLVLFTGGNTVSNNSIDINVMGNSFAAGGEELPLQVQVSNHNTSDLELADLIVDYEKGGTSSSGAGHVSDLNSLGTIPAGKSITKSLFITIFGEQGSTNTIDFTLQYRIHGSNAIFVKKTSFPVTISSTPDALTITAPKTVTPNQDVSLVVDVKSNATNTLSGMLLHVDYPSGFKAKSSTPEATSFDNVWSLGDLAPGAERTITIVGSMFGQDGEDKAFHAYVGAASAGDPTAIGVTYNSLLQVLSITKPFLSANILIDGSPADNVPVSSSGAVQVTIEYKNNLSTTVTNAEIHLGFSGNVFDPSGVTSNNGFYDSSKQALIWSNATGATGLASIAPGDSGILSASFNINTSSSNKISKPKVTLLASISGQQPDQGQGVLSVSGTDQKSAVVSSDIAFSSNTSYATGPFSNTGPMPPKANQPTTYTITWAVSNSLNDISGGVATSSLPQYVDWLGVVSPNSENIVYDANSRKIAWQIGAVPAGSGFSAAPKSVSFQIRLNTSSSQAGDVPVLVNPVAVSATDTFTGEKISVSRDSTFTKLKDESGPGADGVVTN